MLDDSHECQALFSLKNNDFFLLLLLLIFSVTILNGPLSFTTPWANLVDDNIFFYFSKKIGFDSFW